MEIKANFVDLERCEIYPVKLLNVIDVARFLG